jgi:hypothetical protein
LVTAQKARFAFVALLPAPAPLLTARKNGLSVGAETALLVTVWLDELKRIVADVELVRPNQ